MSNQPNNRGCGCSLLVGALVLALLAALVAFLPMFSNIRTDIENAVIEAQAQYVDPAGVGGVPAGTSSITLDGVTYPVTGLTMIVSDSSQCRPADSNVPCIRVASCFSGCSASFAGIRVDSADDLMYLDGILVTDFDRTVDAAFYDVADGSYTLKVQNTIAQWYNLYVLPRPTAEVQSQGVVPTLPAPATTTNTVMIVDGRIVALETELKLVRSQDNCGEHSNCHVAPTCFSTTGCSVVVESPILFTSVDASASLNNGTITTNFTFDQLKDANSAPIGVGSYTLIVTHPDAGNAFFALPR